MKVITEDEEWNKTLDENYGNSDVYFRYEYFNLYEKHYDVKAECIFWENEYLKVFWPHLIRDISKLNKFKDFPFYDLTTPYGYGGPLINVNTTDKIKILKSTKTFFKQYSKHNLKNNYISEFIRFHPLSKNWEHFEGIFDFEHVNDVILVDLLDDLNKIWKNIRKGHKYNIKKSIKEDIKTKFVENPTDEDISKFINLYYSSMDKNNASKKYYFSPDFIKDHFKLLNTVLVIAEHEEKILGMSMFIYENNLIHYHLSATSTNSDLFASHLIIYETIKWAKERNFRCLQLGGGRGANDSLFEFKKGFSKLTRPFFIAKLIFNRDIYRDLSKQDNSSGSTDYFPKYRYGLDKTIV